MKIGSKEIHDNPKGYLEKEAVINHNFIMQPDEDLARAITADELMKGVKEDLREIFKKSKK